MAADRMRPQAASASVVPVQQSPQYQDAVRHFVRHDYPAALTAINSLLQQP